MNEDFDNAPCGFLSLNNEGIIRRANSTLLRMLGHDRDQVEGQHVAILLSAGSRIYYQTHLFPLLKMTGEVEEIFLTLRTRNGEEVPMLLNAKRVDRQGVMEHDCVLVRMRERANFEEELLKAKRAAQKANKAKDDFLAALSHELRNPLNPVLMLSTAMEMDLSLPAEAREQLGIIRRNAELEARLIDDLLDLTRITHGKMKLVRSPVDVHSLLNQTQEIVRSDGQSKRVPVRFFKEAKHHFVDADAARLQQVFWNLLKNAIKFTPAGKEVSVSTRNEGPDKLVIEVRDSGIGIDADVLPRIFDAFEQGRVSTQHFGGLGLGLAISKSIVDMHGGTITAASPGKDKGATFAVELHACAVPADGALVRPAEARKVTKLRLLLVEDHDSTRQVLARILERSGHTVHAAATAGEALHLAETAGPMDVLISDLGLPDMSGFELMRRIRAAHDIPGIALSGYGMDEDLLMAREAGFTAHLVKPVSLEQLRVHLDEISASH